MKILTYIFSVVGTLLALFASGFYTLFTETIAGKEFWVGILLLIFALLGASSTFLLRKNPKTAQRNLIIAGIGGILSFLFLAGLSPALVDTNSYRIILVDLGGYVLFLLAGLLVGKSTNQAEDGDAEMM